MIRLTVKGSQADARKAAAERNIILDDLRSVHEGETLCFTHGSYYSAVVKWMNETSAKDIIPGYGFPAGSCLWYRSDI